MTIAYWSCDALAFLAGDAGPVGDDAGRAWRLSDIRCASVFSLTAVPFLVSQRWANDVAEAQDVWALFSAGRIDLVQVASADLSRAAGYAWKGLDPWSSLDLVLAMEVDPHVFVAADTLLLELALGAGLSILPLGS